MGLSSLDEDSLSVSGIMGSSRKGALSDVFFRGLLSASASGLLPLINLFRVDFGGRGGDGSFSSSVSESDVSWKLRSSLSLTMKSSSESKLLSSQSSSVSDSGLCGLKGVLSPRGILSARCVLGVRGMFRLVGEVWRGATLVVVWRSGVSSIISFSFSKSSVSNLTMGLWRGVWLIGRRRELTFAVLRVLVFFCFPGELFLLSRMALSSEKMSNTALDPRLCRCDDALERALVPLPVEDLMLVCCSSEIESRVGNCSFLSFRLFVC